MSITVVLPSRGRPAAAQAAVESVLTTRRLPDTRVHVVLDSADPALGGYEFSGDGVEVTSCEGNMIVRTNSVAMTVAYSPVTIVGWMADDNRMRTPGWDERVTETLARPNVLFTNLNDLFWSEKFPNDKPVNTFIRTTVVRALGWFANPAQRHHYMDDTWRLLGYSTDSMVYLPDVICEHMHPAIGKGQSDEQYRAIDEGKFAGDEQGLFQQWLWTAFREDRLRVKTCLDS